MQFPCQTLDCFTQKHTHTQSVWHPGIKFSVWCKKAILLWHMIIIKSWTNQVSVNHLHLSLQDVIRALVYSAVCLMVQRTREEIWSSNPAAQQNPWIYVSIMWQAILNWVAHPMTLLIPLISECILCLSISISHTKWHTNSQLGSIQLVPTVTIISRFPSVCLWTVRAPMAIAMCK